MNVSVVVGSLRKASLNRMLAITLISLASPMLRLGIVEIGQLPLYNQDLDDDPPAQQLRRVLRANRKRERPPLVS
jgi:chromate reductase